MDVCCKNVVLRMIYLIIKEIVPAMLIELKDGHDIDMFKKFTKKAAPAPPPQASIPGPPSGNPSTSYSAAGSRPRPPPQQPRPRDHDESNFLSESWGNPMPQFQVPANPYETAPAGSGASASGSADRRSRNEDNSSAAYPPNPDPTKKFRASFDTSGRGDGVWGRPNEPRGPDFMDSDFPALDKSGDSLGALWGNSNERGGGPGGRGRGLGMGAAPSGSQPWGGPRPTGGRGGGRR